MDPDTDPAAATATDPAPDPSLDPSGVPASVPAPLATVASASATAVDRRAVLGLGKLWLTGFGVAGLALAQPLRSGAALAAQRRPDRKPESPANARRLVMLDPGHGGNDPGAIGTRGTFEKDVTLDIARETARALADRHGVAARMTRQDDRFLALDERVALAREAGADLFVSIHADSAPTADARGLSAYILSEKASDAFASRLAQQENQADRFGKPGAAGSRVLKDILLDLTARHTRTASLAARQLLVEGAGRELHLLENPMRAANFAVLKAPDVPSVLVETGFLSNPRDEEILCDPAARRVVARILGREIAKVLSSPAFA
ncbi:N-acetylmuramoyl-L-alanine amidase family protein [Azospirillum picis]|uniref:N-acetylmuramoyl-L-alanine amidase n=1 Tax=Azospirillum picis TaxID=488438 RepID=A0ABU0MI37_9PROT|nr:N-acetylmuramoyl-L-alanine amidase [Azospirillum picis]MBP2298867.1 N-acetylmuramoyl-L-alanine amidase [Azospirillum picis]MDQ0532891.1 N-acetylmuramoyl-L-alanine amidase [Azospirillum picis]